MARLASGLPWQDGGGHGTRMDDQTWSTHQGERGFSGDSGAGVFKIRVICRGLAMCGLSLRPAAELLQEPPSTRPQVVSGHQTCQKETLDLKRVQAPGSYVVLTLFHGGVRPARVKLMESCQKVPGRRHA